MKKTIFILAFFVAAVAATAGSVVIWQDDFESYTQGSYAGQGNAEVMQSTVNCIGEKPAPGEVMISLDGRNKVLKLNKKWAPSGVTRPELDRGVRVPLDWGGTVYDPETESTILIKGKVLIPEGGGYAETRLVTKDDEPILRFTPHSSDYKTYIYNIDHDYEVNGSAANANHPAFSNCSYPRTWYPTESAVKYNVWCDFELEINCRTATVNYYTITDNNGFEFTGIRICHLPNMLERPEYVEFTAVGNGFDLNRTGASFDDLEVTYSWPETPDEWETLYEDDFQSYELGESLTEANENYQRLGDWQEFSDLIATNEFMGETKFALLYMGKPGDGLFPKDGIFLNIPEEDLPDVGEKIRLTVKAYVPDNGYWNMFRLKDAPLATYGIHSATIWFATFGGNDFEPRYDGCERAFYKNDMTTSITLLRQEDGYYLLSTDLLTPEAPKTRLTTEWLDYYPECLGTDLDNAAIQLQGWNNFNGRYIYLHGIKLERTVPEPVFASLLCLLVFVVSRRCRQ